MSNKIEPRLLVILYQGEEVPAFMAEKFIDALVTARIIPVKELSEVNFYNADDIAKLIGSNTLSTSEILNSKINDKINEETDSIVHSLVYIGRMYEDCNQDPSVFALRLSADLSNEMYKQATGKPCNNELITAVEILSTKTINRAKYKKCMLENNISEPMLKTIFAAYRYHYGKHIS